MTATHIAIVGGGRWAKVHVTVLSDLLNTADKITWITSHNADENAQWLNERGFSNVIIANKTPFDDVDGVIISTASHTHAALLKEVLNYKIPCLCEKPFALDYKTAQKLTTLSTQNKTPAAMNIEFIHASYLQDFKNIISNKDIQNIDIEWHDLLVEIHNDVFKPSDIYTPIAFDHVVHCWSLLYALFGHIDLKLKNVTYNLDKNIEILAALNNTNVRFSVSRHASIRTRKISINGDEAVLDFSSEPGHITHDGIKSDNQWNGQKPMGIALTQFLGQIKSPDAPSWKESVQNTLPAIKFCEESHKALQNKTNIIKDNFENLSDGEKIIFALDYYGPRLAEDKKRVSIATIEDRQNAFNEIIKTYS